jgi:hypothetical protein
MRLAVRLGAAVAFLCGAVGPLPAAPALKDPPRPNNGRLRHVQSERVKALEQQLQGQFERVKIGKDPLGVLLDASREWADLKVQLAETKEAKVEVRERVFRQLFIVEEQLTQLQQAGLQTQEGVAQATAARLRAGVELEELKAAK